MPTIFTQTDKDNIIRGPGLIWFDVPLPAHYGSLELDNDGRPAGGGKLAGFTRSGWSWTLGVEQPPEECWPGQRPLAVVAPTGMTITAEVVGLRDLALLEYLLPAMYRTSDLVDYFTLGSPRKPMHTPSLLVVFRQTDQRPFPPVVPAPKQYGYVMIYQGINIEDFSFNVTRRDYSSARFTFRAVPVISRPFEDQYGQYRTYAVLE